MKYTTFFYIYLVILAAFTLWMIFFSLATSTYSLTSVNLTACVLAGSALLALSLSLAVVYLVRSRK